MAKGHRSKHHHSEHKHHHDHSDELPVILAPPISPVGPWSGWTLHSSGLYYYRARSILWEYAQNIENSRNSVVPDGRGGYCHYEFIGAKEVPYGYSAQASMNAYYAEPPPSWMTPDFAYGAPQFHQQEPQHQPQLLLPAPEVLYDDDDGDSGFSGNSGSGSVNRPTVIDVNRTSEGLEITFPTVSDDHFIVCDKKSRKRPGSDKKSRVSHKSKVNTWLGN